MSSKSGFEHAQPNAAPAKSFTPSRLPVLQRKCACSSGGECDQCSSAKGPLQRSAAGPTTAEVPSSVHSVLNSSGSPLDAGTRSFMESRFGQDFSGVRVHTDGVAAQSARDVNAHAYTVGQDIAFASGRYEPN